MENHLTFTGHLEELRIRIIVILIFVLAASVVSFLFIDILILFLKQPLKIPNADLYFFKPQEKILTGIRLSITIGLLAAIPLIMLQTALFVMPAISLRHKILLFLTMAISLLLFAVGFAVAYLYLTPAIFKLLLNFPPMDGVLPFMSLSATMDLVIAVLIVSGLILNFPVVLSVLIGFKVLTVEMLRKFRKHIIVAIVIFAAVITPTVDFVTQILVSVVLYLLFEITLLFSSLILHIRYNNNKEQ